MNEDFNTWLDSLNPPIADSLAEIATSESTEESSASQAIDEVIGEVNFHLPNQTIGVPIIEEEASEEPETSSLSLDDFNDILSDMGFQESSEEEIHDGSDDAGVISDDEEVYDNNIGEERDLDAEEDADWERLGQLGILHRETESSEEEVPREDEATNGELVEGILLPENSPTLLRDDSTSRFSGTEWYDSIRKSKIILAGVGGIGSWAALQIARMHPTSLFLYDPDIVETVNMSGQLYSSDDVGRYKVDAIASMIDNYTSMQSVYAIRERFNNLSEAGDIMICGFDNMEARRTFFNAWELHVLSKPEEGRKNCVFIDGRLSVDTLQVFCITGDDSLNQQRYEDKFLFSDSEADNTVCSMKQTTYLACMIGSVIVNLFTNFIAGLLDPIIPYDLPFFTQYEAQHMLFKTEH